MCGIAIQLRTHLCNHEKISHRGIIGGSLLTEHHLIHHYKLPLQTGVNDEFNQPVKLRNGNILLFNGEIFNTPECFKNDVHYLINFFNQKDWKDKIGGEEYNGWDGFWAICIIETSGNIYAFTDPLGKKQLYYREGCISSEIKPLLDEKCSPELIFDSREVQKTLYTPFNRVYRITPNNLYKFVGRSASIIKYNLFDLRKEPSKWDLYGLIEESVKSRLINILDSNTLFLSGGLDSTIILHHLFKLGVLKDFQLLTIDNIDDAKYIEAIEQYFDCKVDRIQSNKLTEGEKEEIIKKYEYPLERGSLFQQYRLCENTKGSVIFSGDGADELFSGYRRALKSDTQEFDVFEELPYYHNIRLDRMTMVFTKENRSPFLGHEVVRYALNCPYDLRKGKQILRDLYKGLIPQSIIDRKKAPLREVDMVLDRTKYIEDFIDRFKKIEWNI